MRLHRSGSLSQIIDNRNSLSSSRPVPCLEIINLPNLTLPGSCKSVNDAERIVNAVFFCSREANRPFPCHLHHRRLNLPSPSVEPSAEPAFWARSKASAYLGADGWDALEPSRISTIFIPKSERSGDEFPPGAQNRITSAILPPPVIENTKFSSPGVCFATGEIIYLGGGMCSAAFLSLFFPYFCISFVAG